MKVQVAVLGSPSLTVLMVSEDIKQHFNYLLGQDKTSKFLLVAAFALF